MNTNKGKETMRSSCQVKRYYTDPINTLLNPTINNSDGNTESESESAMSESDPDKTLLYQIPEEDDSTETHELLSSSLDDEVDNESSENEKPLTPRRRAPPKRLKDYVLHN